MRTIAKFAVLGAGTMGAGIAAHLANAGKDVLLLDQDAERARAGVSNQLKAGGFMHPSFATRVRPGSIHDDLPALAAVDWVIEAVAEKLDVKQSLYRSVAAVRRAGTIVSSNTSTILARSLAAGMPSEMARHFLITHFFNPPRQMPLLELVPGPDTLADVVADVADFADIELGKSVVHCLDTPGFIANRIGCYWLAAALDGAVRSGIGLDEADFILSNSFGIPGTGCFGLLDLIGIDVFSGIVRTLQHSLPPDDPIQRFDAEPAVVAGLIAAGRFGRKAAAGFYRRTANRSREVIDPATQQYRPADTSKPIVLQATALLDALHDDADFARQAMLGTLAYAASLSSTIAETPDQIDAAMRLGYGWRQGPFALAAEIGIDRVRDYAKQHGFGPVAAIAVASPHIARPGSVVAAATGASLYDMGQNVACLELNERLNPLGPALLDTVETLAGRAFAGFGALVIASQGDNFSVGADLKHVLDLCATGNRADFGAIVDQGQRVMTGLKRAPIPTVGAVNGLALGGGFELLLHCTVIQAHAEARIGLVETRVGLVPGWGGSKEMLLRFADTGIHGPVAPALSAFALIRAATTSTNAYDARALGLLRATDGITMNRHRLLDDARQRAGRLMEGYAPPVDATLRLAGPSGASALFNILDNDLLAGRLTPHQRAIGARLAQVLTGENTDPLQPLFERDVMAFEREAFCDLVMRPETPGCIRAALGMAP